MKEIRGNLWAYFDREHIIAITTNGTIKANGSGVMGRGCAAEAKTRIHGIEKVLGTRLREHGNGVVELNEMPTVISFPVKHQWWEKADLELIQRSAAELVEFMMYEATGRPVILPRPGCGNGGRTWAEVKPLVSFLPDKVWVISY